MKRLILISVILSTTLICSQINAQWSSNGNNIYNNNTGFVGISTNTPTTLLHAARNMTEPAITVQNLGGTGGATFRMWDNASGADWKFKATLTGGFKIRDNAYGLDVIVIEPDGFANALYVKATGTIGIGTAAPDNSALVDLNSNSKGFLIPRMNQSQMVAISSPADGLIVYCTTDGVVYIYVATLNHWKEISYGSNNYSPFSCGASISVNHVAGQVAPVSKTVTYGTVTNVPGEPAKCWITSNLGADHQATAKDDATEASAGWYWQFNMKQGYKHDGTLRTPNSTWINQLNENSGWILFNDPCNIELGSGWRLPTLSEWTNVDAAGGWTSWNGPWNSVLKLHAPGHLLATDGSLDFRGTYGNYWSSAQQTNDQSWYLRTASYMSEMNYYDAFKSNGFSIRCIRD